jgi:peptide deformylase
MALLEIITAPDPRLKVKAKPVAKVDAEVRRLMDDMLETMYLAIGVGLAAPQVGVAVRVFALDVTGHPKAHTCHGTLVLCNAEIVEATRWQKGREGCMSVPDLTGDVKRAGHLVVSGQLPGTAETVSLETDAFEARALQHEIDHCAGLLFLDRVAGPHAIFARKVYL